EALPGAGELARHLKRRGREGLERGDGIPEVRREEVRAMVASTPADFRQERVSGGTCVELGDEIDRRRQTPRHALEGETLVAEVLVDVPDPAPLTLCCGRDKPRAAVAETEGRQPALCEEAVCLCDGRRVAFQHERTVACAANAQAVNRLLQSVQLHRPLQASSDAVADHPLQKLAQVRPTRLLPLHQAALQLTQIDRAARPTRHPLPFQSRARSRTRPTTRQPSKYSSA